MILIKVPHRNAGNSKTSGLKILGISTPFEKNNLWGYFELTSWHPGGHDSIPLLFRKVFVLLAPISFWPDKYNNNMKLYKNFIIGLTDSSSFEKHWKGYSGSQHQQMHFGRGQYIWRFDYFYILLKNFRVLGQLSWLGFKFLLTKSFTK